jgi:hypothetical protein
MVNASHHADYTIKVIFISWSKSRSLRAALALQVLIRHLFGQYLRVFMSTDVAIGKEFLVSLNEMLREADLVVPCMTSENWREPWIFYEAGVVFGKTNRAVGVCPYIVDLYKKRGELPLPLWQFKAVMADRDGTLHLVRFINDHIRSGGDDGGGGEPNGGDGGGQPPYTGPQLDRKFNELWPELDEVIKANQPPPDPPDPRSCVEDYSKVKICIDGHQDRLELRLGEWIDRALEAVRSGTYDYEQIIDSTWREIEASKERYRNTNNILVGDVADFFGDNYSEDDLRRVVKSMEPDLRNLSEGRDSHPAKERLVDLMRRALQEAFTRFHLIALARLKECLGEEEDG